MALVSGAVLVLASGPLSDPDVWWHVRLGQQIISTHHIPRTETWSFAAAGRAWNPTAWLSDVLYGAVVNVAGYRGLIGLKLVVAALALVLLYRLIRYTGQTPMVTALAFALTVLPLSSFLRERPQAFSLLFVIWISWECDRVRRGHVVRPLRFLLLQYLWANVHGMWFVGPAFLIVAAVGDLATEGRVAVPRLRRHVGLAAGALAVAAATPIGPALVLQPFRVASAAKLVSEWRPTVLWDGPLAGYVIALCIVIAAFALRRDRATPAEALWVVCVFVFSLVAGRNTAPSFILLAPVLAGALGQLVTFRPAARITPLVPGFLMAASAIAAVGIAATEQPVSPQLPTRLVAELGNLPAPRHVLDDYDIGGLITGTQRGASVAIDGRTDNYSPAYVRQYFSMLGLTGHWQQLLARLQPDCALLRTGSPITHVLVAEYHWQLVDRADGYTLLERGSSGRLPAGSA